MMDANERAKRDAAIFRDFRGGAEPNVLAMKYQLTAARIRQIAAREQNRRRRKRRSKRSR